MDDAIIITIIIILIIEGKPNTTTTAHLLDANEWPIFDKRA